MRAHWTWVLGFVLVASAAGARDLPPIVAPLGSEGYLWAPPLDPLPRSDFVIKFGLNYHAMEVWPGRDVEVHFTALQFLLGGEIELFKDFTVGADVPFLSIHSASSSPDFVDSSGIDFGNIRLHARYLAVATKSGLVVTPAFRVWLPTNTFLDVETIAPLWPNMEVLDTLAVFEPILCLGWANRRFSALLETGPKLAMIESADDFSFDDFSFWSFDFVFGARPLQNLELLLELNLMTEMSDDKAPSEPFEGNITPFALSAGARLKLGDWMLEVTLRAGLHEAVFYYGQFNIGLAFGYRF